MGIKRHKPEEIVTKLRQVEVLVGQGMARVAALSQLWAYQGSGTNARFVHIADL